MIGERKFKTGIWIFPAILLATLLQSYYDISGIFSGASLALYAYKGPIAYKIGKDLIYFWILFSLLIYSKKIQKTPFTDFSAAIIILSGFLFFISAFSNGIFVAALGVRWVLPFLLFLLMRNWAVAIDKYQAVRWLYIGLAICIAAQIYQIFNMPPVFGEIFPGIPARTPGIFLAPNSTAFFACSSTAYMMVLVPHDRKTIFTSLLLALAISLLAQSGTGIVASAILAARVIYTRRSRVFWILAALVGFFVFMNLNRITGREDYLELSGGGRLNVLYSIFMESSFSLGNFGIFTNAANLQSINPEKNIAVDSLVASWIGNFGALSVYIFILVICFIKLRMRAVNWRVAMPSVMVFLLFAPTTIVFEAFPMNIFIAMGIWAAATASTEVNQSFH